MAIFRCLLPSPATSLIWLIVLASLRCIQSDEAVPVASDARMLIEQTIAKIQQWQDQFSLSSVQADRPFLTLSFAQSLDGKIAGYTDHGETTNNYPLSGPETQMLTHAVRSIHDGILIGGRTLLIDNPRLTNRLWSSGNPGKQPRPIVVDTHLEYVYKLGESCRVQNLIACCSEEAAESFESLPATVQVLPCRCTSDGRLDLHDVLYKLRTRYGIRSLMVEGGAAILTSFLRGDLIDCLCITIAPKVLGNGVAPTFAGVHDCDVNADNNAESLSDFVLLGSDCVFVNLWRNSWKSSPN